MSIQKKYLPIPFSEVNVTDGFWKRNMELVRNVVIPYQWEALNDRIPDAESSHAIRNFQIAAGEAQGEFTGMVFQDSDLYKWLEAVAYSLVNYPDSVLESYADSAIDLIVKAQAPDGYINTYFLIKEPDKRWTNLLDCHELYCAGHLIEAAVAYYKATGKEKLLNAVCRFVGYIYTVFGKEDGKLRGYPGHPEIELALMRLYEVTGNEKHKNLAKYFIDERGQQPLYFDLEWERRGKKSFWKQWVAEIPNLEHCGKDYREYNQYHKPVREQTEAVGHAVRALYLYSGMVDVAAGTGDDVLWNACEKLWDNVTKKQMYITGGVGATHLGEAFTFDYNLPNDSVYAETCASIALMFFAHRMLQLKLDRKYSDVMEKVLYNILVSSMSQDGCRYFYVNPLEVVPEADEKSPILMHVKPVRQKWFSCACCPPNLARLLMSLGEYIYTANEDCVFVHLYIGSETQVKLKDGSVKLSQTSDYPWDGTIRMTVDADIPEAFAIALRIPAWCRKAGLSVNNDRIETEEIMTNGYAVINRIWKPGDVIELELSILPEFIAANPEVRSDAGKVAIMRGPVLYCIEEYDNGENLSAVSVCTDQQLQVHPLDICKKHVIGLRGKAMRIDEDGWKDTLYQPYVKRKNPVEFTAIPYYLWGNRTKGEMTVWMRID